MSDSELKLELQKKDEIIDSLKSSLKQLTEFNVTKNQFAQTEEKES